MIEPDELSIGTVKAVFGLDGFLTVRSHSGEFAHFRKLRDVILLKGGKRSKARIGDVEEGQLGLLLRFEGAAGVEAARALIGSEIIVPREKAAPLRADEYYATDLAGCSLLCGGKAVAEILSIIEGGAYDFLESKLPDGRVALVPFAKEFIGEVDLAARRVELLKEWILE